MNAKKKEFEVNERLLATKLFNIIPTIKNYIFSEKGEAYDTIIELEDLSRIIGEIKVRNFQVNKYDTYILELGKLRGLINRANQNKCHKIYYINFFFNEAKPFIYDFIIFDLTPRIRDWKENPHKLEVDTKKMWMNRVTYNSTKDKVEKVIIMLSYDEKVDCKGILPVYETVC